MLVPYVLCTVELFFLGTHSGYLLQCTVEAWWWVVSEWYLFKWWYKVYLYLCVCVTHTRNTHTFTPCSAWLKQYTCHAHPAVHPTTPFHRFEMDADTAWPTMCPVVQHDWKLKPPVTPSTFNNSPPTYKCFHRLVSIVCKCRSFKSTPPAVTNSSLFVSLPTNANLALNNTWHSCATWCLLISFHRTLSCPTTLQT